MTSGNKVLQLRSSLTLILLNPVSRMEITTGVNAYGVYPAPRSSGAEAIVISASWVSRTNEGDGTPNMRGVATVLALAGYLSSWSCPSSF